MGRPPLTRTIARLPRAAFFKPAGVPARELERIELGIDEVEALRLVDLEGLSQEEAAADLGVSRQTVGRILEQARRKIADALVNGKAVLIGGGVYVVAHMQVCADCGHRWPLADAAAAPSEACPSCGSAAVRACVGAGRGGGPRRGGQAGHDGGRGGPCRKAGRRGRAAADAVGPGKHHAQRQRRREGDP